MKEKPYTHAQGIEKNEKRIREVTRTTTPKGKCVAVTNRQKIENNVFSEIAPSVKYMFVCIERDKGKEICWNNNTVLSVFCFLF